MTEEELWRKLQLTLIEIGKVIEGAGFSWCSDEYPKLEVLDWKGRKTLTFIEFKDTPQLKRDIAKLKEV